MKRTILFLGLIPASVMAGDSPLFWRFGTISDRILIYLDEGVIRTNVPTSVFLFGLLISALGILGFLLMLPTKYKRLREFVGAVPVLASLGAFALSWIFGSIGEEYFGHYSVRLFWSWHSIGAMIAGLAVLLAFLRFRTFSGRRHNNCQ